MPHMFSTDLRKQPTLPRETSCLPSGEKKRSCLPPKPLLVGAAGIYDTGVRHSILSCFVQCFKGTVHGAGEEKIQDGGKVEERRHSTSRSSFGKRATASRSQEKLKEIIQTSNC